MGEFLTHCTQFKLTAFSFLFILPPFSKPFVIWPTPSVVYVVKRWNQSDDASLSDPFPDNADVEDIDCQFVNESEITNLI